MRSFTILIMLQNSWGSVLNSVIASRSTRTQPGFFAFNRFWLISSVPKRSGEAGWRLPRTTNVVVRIMRVPDASCASRGRSMAIAPNARKGRLTPTIGVGSERMRNYDCSDFLVAPATEPKARFSGGGREVSGTPDQVRGDGNESLAREATLPLSYTTRAV